MPRGGARPGAGRPRGRLNVASKKRIEQAANEGITPLEYMLKVLRSEDQPHEERMKAAVSAAPYVHPRLNAINHSGQVNITHEEALLALGSIDDAMNDLDADESHSGVTH